MEITLPKQLGILYCEFWSEIGLGILCITSAIPRGGAEQGNSPGHQNEGTPIDAAQPGQGVR